MTSCRGRSVRGGVAARGTAAALTLLLLIAGCAGGSASETPARERDAGAPRAMASVSTANSSSVTAPTPAVNTTLAAMPTDPAAYVRSRDRWTFDGRPGTLITTQHYRLFTTMPDGLILMRLPMFLERAVHHYTTALTPLPFPDTALETYMMATKPQWKSLATKFLGDNAEIALRIPRGGFAYDGRALYYDIGTQDSFAISAHEGWHQYTQRVFREPLPIWLEEGIATYMEGFRWDDSRPDVPNFMGWSNEERYDALRAAAGAGRLFPLKQLLATSPGALMKDKPDDSLVYYAQVWALVHFLREGSGGAHAAKLVQLINDAREGAISRRVGGALGAQAAANARLRRVGPEVFVTYFNADLDAAQRDFTAFVQRVVAVGSKNKIIAGQSPLR